MKIKLNIKTEIRVAVLLAAVTALVAFADRNLRTGVVNDIVVRLDNNEENHFLDERDVLRMIESTPGRIRQERFDHINYREIENRLRTHRNFRTVELFNDFKGNMVVNVSLRRPMARLVQENGPDAYLSEEGLVMSTSERYSSRVLIVSGPWVGKALIAQDLNRSELGRQLLEMIRYVKEDDFLRAQVAEMRVGQEGSVTLYPQVSSQAVIFGKPERLEEKFLKFKVFYRKILPQRGWTRYDRINLEFEGQVIAQ